MSQIKQKGVPTRRTPGALGDVYTDLNTGFTYKCIGSYGVMGSPDADYQWKRTNVPANPVKPAVKAEPKPAKDEKKVEAPKAEEKVEKKPAKKVEKKEVEVEAAAEQKKQPRNYTKYSENKSAE